MLLCSAATCLPNCPTHCVLYLALDYIWKLVEFCSSLAGYPTDARYRSDELLPGFSLQIHEARQLFAHLLDVSVDKSNVRHALHQLVLLFQYILNLHRWQLGT